MWTRIVWGVCIGLESFLVIWAVKTRLLRRFPIFYSFISLVLVVDVLAIPLFRMSSHTYFLFYWSTAFLKAVLGYGIIMETYVFSLKNYPGVGRLLRILLVVILLTVAAKVAVSLVVDSKFLLPYAIAVMERNLQQVQAILLFCLLALFIYYKIPADRNVRGLMLGYAFLIGADVISFTFITNPSTGFALLMRQIDPACNALALIIWTVALWTASPQSALQWGQVIETDYEYLARETRAMLLRARTHLVRVARP